jgi:hypothetical protein
VEHFARIALVTHQLGRQKLLTDNDVGKLIEARERYGSSAERVPGCPVTAPAQGSTGGTPEGERPSQQGNCGGEKFTVSREELASIVEDALRYTKRRW